jgi:hypothetical protein
VERSYWLIHGNEFVAIKQRVAKGGNRIDAKLGWLLTGLRLLRQKSLA